MKVDYIFSQVFSRLFIFKKGTFFICICLNGFIGDELNMSMDDFSLIRTSVKLFRFIFITQNKKAFTYQMFIYSQFFNNEKCISM
jgi:hypothetical protein